MNGQKLRMQPLGRDAVKGMESLLASGTVEPAPEAIASFLRQHKESLDTTQVGEYFGHHEDLAVRFPLPLAASIPPVNLTP